MLNSNAIMIIISVLSGIVTFIVSTIDIISIIKYCNRDDKFSNSIEILKEQKENTPIILLDDVFSELDRGRINFLIDYVSKYQVFITTTEIESIDNIENKEIFKIKNGTVEKIKN